MKKEWSEEERKAIEAKYMAELDIAELERDYAQLVQEKHLVAFEDVIRAVEKQQSDLAKHGPAQ